MIGEKGQYIINEVPPRKPKVVIENKAPVKKPPMQHRTREVGTLVDAVHQWPQFPGGADAFMAYLEKVGKDGVPVNFKILKSVKDSDELNDELIVRLENMGTWKPALLHDKPVAKKMIQTVTIEVKEK